MKDFSFALGAFISVPYALLFIHVDQATEQWFHLIIAKKVVQNCKSEDKTLSCDHFNESSRAVLLCNTVCYVVQSDSKLSIRG